MYVHSERESGLVIVLHVCKKMYSEEDIIHRTIYGFYRSVKMLQLYQIVAEI